MSMPTTANPRILALLVVLLCCPSGPAQAQNLLTNPDFDGPGGLDLWAVQTGSMVLGADSGSCTTSGASGVRSSRWLATSGPSGGGDQGFWITSQQCIVVDPVTTPVMQVAGMYRGMWDALVADSDAVFMTASASATDATWVMGLNAKAGSKLAALAAAQKPNDFSLLRKVPARAATSFLVGSMYLALALRCSNDAWRSGTISTSSTVYAMARLPE